MKPNTNSMLLDGFGTLQCTVGMSGYNAGFRVANDVRDTCATPGGASQRGDCDCALSGCAATTACIARKAGSRTAVRDVRSHGMEHAA
eukprot:1804324-Rhodomonas_salina.5